MVVLYRSFQSKGTGFMKASKRLLKAGLPALMLAAAVVLIGTDAAAVGEATLDGKSADKTPAATQSAAYQWLDIALEATAREHERNAPRPTIGARMMAIVVTA